MGHPDFRVNGRVFAAIHADTRTGMVKLLPHQQLVFVQGDPSIFMPQNGAWGRQGYTRVYLAPADEETVGEAMTLAWRNAATPPERVGSGRRFRRIAKVRR